MSLTTRLRAVFGARFDSRTGRRRRPWAALAGGIALALFIGSGVAVAATSSAQAHNPYLDATCSNITIKAEWYNTDNGEPTPNKVVATIDGVTTTQNFGFAGTGADMKVFTFPISDSTKPHTYSISVIAWDDADFAKGWSKTFEGSTPTCDPPAVAGSAAACNVKGGTTALTADFSRLIAGRPYTVDLSTGGSVIQSFSITSTQAVWPDTVTGLPASWATLPAGKTYTIAITDSTNASLTARTDVVSVGCPTQPDLTVDIQQCIATGKSGTFTITANVTTGREYEIQVFKDGAVIDTIRRVLTGPTFSQSYVASPSSSFWFTLRDVAAGTDAVTSATAKTIPCPVVPDKPQLTLTQCTATEGPSTATLGITVTKLVVDRAYTITVSGGPTVVAPVTLSPALSSTWTLDPAITLAPGTYTVTVTDVTDPRATGFTASETAVFVDCPRQQKVALAATTCEVPGGKTDVTASVTGFQVGRVYTIALTQNNLPVAGQPASAEFTPTTAATPYTLTYAGLIPGVPYRVVVTDKAVTSVISAADITPVACPGNPGSILNQASCTFTTTTKVSVTLDKLVTGETYTVSVATKSNGQPVAGVSDQKLTANAPTATLVFSNLPYNKEYTVTVANATKTLTSTSTIFLKICEIDLPTLAYTGASTMTPSIAGIGFLQFGLVLVGIGLLKRRSGARGA